MAAIGHVVRRVSHDLCSNFATEQYFVTPGVKRITVENAMDTEVPHITRLRHARPLRLKGRNVVIGIAGKLARAGFPSERIRLRTEQPVSVNRIKPRHLEIEIEIRYQQLLQLRCQRYLIPD